MYMNLAFAASSKIHTARWMPHDIIVIIRVVDRENAHKISERERERKRIHTPECEKKKKTLT